LKSAGTEHDPKPKVVVAIVQRIPVTVRRPTIPGVVVPRTTTHESGLPTPKPTISVNTDFLSVSQQILTTNSNHTSQPNYIYKKPSAFIRVSIIKITNLSMCWVAFLNPTYDLTIFEYLTINYIL
jgi:hypothetical protein